jgi:hypothetical protein
MTIHPGGGMLGYRLMRQAVLDEQAKRWRREWNELQGLRKRSGELEAQLAELTNVRELARVAEGRAEHAESMVRLQAKTIERLMDSNDRMAKLVGDMRRVGFGILEPLEVNEESTSTLDADRAAVEANDELAADDDL